MIVVVDTGLGNRGSIVNMVRRTGAEVVLGAEAEVLLHASGLILPGVGAFDRGVRALRDRGLVPVLEEARARGVPILGICLGMQLLARRSEEGVEPGLGWIDADVVRFRREDLDGLPVPHMGWSDVRFCDIDPLAGVPNPRFYFVHSYHVICDDPGLRWCEADYGGSFAAGVRSGNVFGVQFHPEKSHRFGLAFLNWFVTEAIEGAGR